ncbi:sulfotransferase family protein [Streptomyces sp. NRRL S-646]|uniref:sulfotransferase-like domain-containing protein n=1 Tax=Streptomyces sp. NRRL S-646 TaxID=1463917 RepID=UPI0004CA64E0|nr:sulfotransferase family protein [Streptomyces sp. NRRL S-646]
MTEKPMLLALWSVPRSRSTAFERAMYERGDFLVIHEPFSRVSDFGEVDVEGRTCTSQEQVMAALVELAADRPVFFKDTTDFRIDALGANPDFLKRCRHAAMVRNPGDTVRSHLVMQADAPSEAMGFGNLWDIVSAVTDAGLPMHLVDGDRLADGPEAEMRQYCEAVGIAFMAESLAFRREPPASWKATERWHVGASESNALGASHAGKKQLSGELEDIALAFERDQLPYYERIRETLGGVGA